MMGMTRRQMLLASALASAGMRAGAEALPLARVLVGFAPGGSTDAVARLTAQHLGTYATNVIVDNKPGAGGQLAATQLRSAPADGSNMLLSNEALMALAPHVYKSLPFRMEEFLPVTQVAKVPLAIFAGPMVPAQASVLEFTELARKDKRLAAYGTAGAGSTVHFVGVMLAEAAKLDMSAVHYRGAAPALQDVMGGQLPLFVGAVADGMAHLSSGKLRVLAVTGPQRSSLLPQVPTLQEAGVAGVAVDESFGLYVPAATPRVQVARLHQAVQEAQKSPKFVETLKGLGTEPGVTSQAEFADYITKLSARWSRIVKDSGIKLES